MACHRVSQGTSIWGFAPDVLHAAWNDPHPLQEPLASLSLWEHPWPLRMHNLQFPEAVEDVQAGASPYNRRVVRMLREEMSRVLSPLQVLDLLSEAIDRLPRSAEVGCQLGDLQQAVCNWMEIGVEDERRLEKLNDLLKPIGNRDEHSPESRLQERRWLALIVGGATQMLQIAGDAERISEIDFFLDDPSLRWSDGNLPDLWSGQNTFMDRDPSQ
jgi:hypothetical protein